MKELSNMQKCEICCKKLTEPAMRNSTCKKCDLAISESEAEKAIMEHYGFDNSLETDSNPRIAITTRSSVTCSPQGLEGICVTLPLGEVMVVLIEEMKENPKIADVFNRLSADQHYEGEDEYIVMTKHQINVFADRWCNGRAKAL